jgi:hypothetical protein
MKTSINKTAKRFQNVLLILAVIMIAFSISEAANAQIKTAGNHTYDVSDFSSPVRTGDYIIVVYNDFVKKYDEASQNHDWAIVMLEGFEIASKTAKTFDYLAVGIMSDETNGVIYKVKNFYYQKAVNKEITAEEFLEYIYKIEMKL